MVDNISGDMVHLHNFFGRTAFPILREIIVPALKRGSANFLEFAPPELAEGVSERRNFKTTAKFVGRQTLRKQLGAGSRKRTASRVIPTKSTKQTSRSRRDNFTNISH